MTEYKLVPFEPTEFSKGDTEPRGDCGMFVAGINHNPSSSPRDQWEHRIEVYGDTPEHAEELRDRALRALAAPAVQGEAVGVATPLRFYDAFTTVVFEASKVPVGTKLYTAPQPAEQHPAPDVSGLVQALETTAEKLKLVMETAQYIQHTIDKALSPAREALAPYRKGGDV